MTKNRNLNIFLLTIFTLILSCKTDQQKTIIGITSSNCKSPSDAIVKFKNLNENDVGITILDYAKSQNIEFTSLEENEIESWINNTVFSDKRGNSLIKEWNINDNDICFTQKVRIQSASDSTQISNVDIKICNTVLTKEVSASDSWEFDSKNFTINLKYCFDAITFIKPVGYYEVVERNKQLERSITTDLRKYNTTVYINLKFLDKSSNTEYNKEILSDNGFLYTDFKNWN